MLTIGGSAAGLTDAGSLRVQGQSSTYWQAVTSKGVRDVAWSYAKPTIECSRIAGMIAFFNERVDSVFIDGVEQPKAWTTWS